MGARGNERTPRDIKLTGPETSKARQVLVVHASKTSDGEVTALARYHSALSCLFAVTSAHVRNPGCRRCGVPVSGGSPGFRILLGSILDLCILGQDV